MLTIQGIGSFHFQDHSDYLVFLLTWASNFDFDSVECFVTIVSKYEPSYFCFEGFWKLTFLYISLNGKTVSDGRQFKVLIPWFYESKELMTLQIPQSGWNLAVSAGQFRIVSVSSCQCWNVWRCKLSKLRQPDNQAMALSWTAWWAAYPQATLSLAKVWAQRRCISVVWTC